MQIRLNIEIDPFMGKYKDPLDAKLANAYGKDGSMYVFLADRA